MSFEWFVGFADGASRHTYNLDLAAWVIYSPSRQLVASGGTFLVLATIMWPNTESSLRFYGMPCHVVSPSWKLDLTFN